MQHTRTEVWQVVALGVLLLVWLLPCAAYSQLASPNFQIVRSAVGGAGGTGSSPNYQQASAIGQPAGITGSSEHFTRQAGVLDEGDLTGLASEYALTIHLAGSGTGTIFLDQTPLDCATDFVAMYPTGTELTLSASADTESVFTGWAGPCQGSGTCVVTIQEDVALTANFASSSSTITTTTSEGGTIDPAGDIAVAYSTDQTFTITPNPLFELEDVLVDGIRVGTAAEYTFPAVTGDHTIEPVFARTAYGIHTEPGEGGSIAPSGMVTAPPGGNLVFTITPNSGYQIAQIVLDGDPLAGVTTYPELIQDSIVLKADVTLTSLAADHRLEVMFQPAANGLSAWAGYDFSDALFEQLALWDDFSQRWLAGSGLLSGLEELFAQNYLLRFLIYTAGEGRFVTALGYEYDTSGQIQGIWISDPDASAGQRLLSVSLDLDDDLWYLNTDGLFDTGPWIIAGIQAYDPSSNPPNSPVPEPGTLMLLSLGLLSLVALGKRLWK